MDNVEISEKRILKRVRVNNINVCPDKNLLIFYNSKTCHLYDIKENTFSRIQFDFEVKNIDIYGDEIFVTDKDSVRVIKLIHKDGFYKLGTHKKSYVWYDIVKVFPLFTNVFTYYVCISEKVASFYDVNLCSFREIEFVKYSLYEKYLVFYTKYKIYVFEQNVEKVYEELDDESDFLCFKDKKIYKYKETETYNKLVGCDMQLYINDVGNVRNTKCNKIYLVKECVVLLFERDDKLKICNSTLSKTLFTARGVQDVVFIDDTVFFLQEDFVYEIKFLNRCKMEFKMIDKTIIYQEKEDEFEELATRHDDFTASKVVRERSKRLS